MRALAKKISKTIFILLILIYVAQTQALFRVQNVNASGGVTVSHFDATGLQANEPAQTLVTVGGTNGWFVPACYVVATSATSSGTLPACIITYTDADSGVQQFPGTPTTASASAGATEGLTSQTNAANGGFYAQTATTITCKTQSYVAGSPTMTYALHCNVLGPYY